ncbi:MAG: hypothetical protein ACOZQL_04860 [Myxococcota bacterium]
MHFRSTLVAALLALAACKPTPTPTSDSGVVTPVPAAPATVTAQVGAGAITVRWTLADAANATQLVVARASVPRASSRPASTELQVIAGLAPDAASYEDVDVEPGTFYVYAVALRGAGGRSDFTLQADAVSLSPPAGACQRTVTATDSDGDGLSNADEASGWSVLVDEDGTGTLTTRAVKSNPFSADTDGDGLCDDEESALRIDPRQPDTDGDGLGDFDEVNRWGSSPTNVDSDGDAQGNSGFYDGAELLTRGTSPTLADTDGDGRSDFEEINQNGTNALSAELPQPRLDVVGRIDLGVDVQLENGTTTSNAVTQSFERGTSTTLSRTSASANQHSVESSFTLSTEASVGYPASASVTATGTYSAKEGFVQETSHSASRSSAADSQETFEALTSNAISQNQTITGGHLGLDFVVRNDGTRTFALSNVVVTALRRDRANPQTFTSVATLQFPASANNLVLAEGQASGPIRAQADVSANVALDLLANPGTLFFRTANFTLSDRTGQAFDFTIGEDTASRTALLTIDYGGVRPLERYRVATNVERTASGKAAGVRLGDVLSRVLGLAPGVGYQTAPRAGGTAKVITRVRDVEAQPRPDGGSERFWVLVAPENPDTTLAPVAQRLLSSTADVEDAVLMPRDSLTLAFVADGDGDRLFEREELMYGTFDQASDSDGDGLTDFQEVREGWTVAVDNAFYRANPRVYAVPTTADADQDGWADPLEKQRGTDPNRRDTDGDGLMDSVDPAPTEGPKGAWVKVLGTSGDEAALHVLPAGDAVYVLGTSTGDLDGDGASGGPFVLALDAATGAQRWVVQLEGSTHFSKKLSRGAAGQVFWISDVAAGVVPGLGGSMYLLGFTPAGVLSAVDLGQVGAIGAYTASTVPSGSVEADAQGRFTFFVAPYRQANNRPGVHRAFFSETGTWTGGTTTSGGLAGESWTLVGTSTNGLTTAALIDYVDASCAAGGTQVRVEPLLNNASSAYTNFCAPTPPPRRVALDRQGGMALVFAGAARDTLELRAANGSGGAVWSRDFTNVFAQGARVTGLDVDDTNQFYVGLKPVSGADAAMEVLGAGGARLDLFHLGNPSTQLTSSRRDVVGNLFTAGSSTGGFELYGMNRGGVDLVVLRNPQLTFGN